MRTTNTKWTFKKKKISPVTNLHLLQTSYPTSRWNEAGAKTETGQVLPAVAPTPLLRAQQAELQLAQAPQQMAEQRLELS